MTPGQTRKAASHGVQTRRITEDGQEGVSEDGYVARDPAGLFADDSSAGLGQSLGVEVLLAVAVVGIWDYDGGSVGDGKLGHG